MIKLARDLGYEVRETSIPREMLYIADELFFTGTAAEITPIRSVDRITVGNGRRGPVTEKLQKAFFGLFTGALPDKLRLARSGGHGGSAARCHRLRADMMRCTEDALPEGLGAA